MSEEVARARAALTTHGRTFALASLALPADARDDAAVVYAFCRAADDAIDELRDPGELARLRAELVGMAPPRPLVATFLAVVDRRALPFGPALDLLDGVGSDVGQVRIADEAALRSYAHAVAGTVGLIMAPLLGARDRRAAAHAAELGLAMQLTNIARDVGADALADRVYLPATWLAAEGLTAADVAAGHADPVALHRVVLRTLDEAEVCYQRGEAGLRYLPLRARVSIAIAARVYRAIGVVVRRNGLLALRERAVVSPLARLWYAANGAIVGLFNGEQTWDTA